MFKSFLFTALLISLSQNVLASENAFTVLMRNGFKESDLIDAVKKYPELKDLEIAQDVKLKDSTLKLYAEESSDVYTITKVDKEYEIEKSLVQLAGELKTIDGDIRKTLLDTILKETDSQKLAIQMSEAFKDDFTTTKGLRVNASYSFDVMEYFDNGRFIKYGDVLSGSLIIGQAISKKFLQINPDNNSWELLSEDFYSGDKPFYAPVRSRRVSSLFQLNRRHPVTRRHQPHNGIDFAASSGTAVYPALDGEIITISRSRSKGKFITILHDNGYQTTYMHLKRVEKGLHVGMRVELEDQIGEVGRTGYATGAHLHFGVLKEGYFINPIHLLKSYCYDQKDQYENLDPDLDEKVLDEGEALMDQSEE